MPYSQKKKQRQHGAFIYARFSTENQSEKSIDEQVSDCRDWCAAAGLPVLGVYADYAVSGTKASRPQFDVMVATLTYGQADSVVVYDQSRLARDFLNWFALRQQLESIGVRIYSITQQYVGGDIRDNAVLVQETFLALHNQMHVEDTRRKTKAALRYRAVQGTHTGGKPPLGYDLKDKHLVVNEQEAALVRRIFTDYASGTTYGQLIKALNAEGYRTKAGNPFGNNSLHDLLQNRRYIGQFVFGGKAYNRDGSRTRTGRSPDTVTVEHPELVIIEKEIFEEVQKRMSANQKIGKGRPTTAREYPLRGKVFCAECGSSMWVQKSTSKGHTYEYYSCVHKKNTGRCDLRKIRCDELEQKVLSYVRSILGNADVSAQIHRLVREQIEAITQNGQDHAQRLADELQDTQRQLDRVVNAIAEIGLSESLKAKLQTLEAKKSELTSQLTAIRNAAEAAALPAEKLTQLVNRIIDNYSDTAVFSVVTRVEVGNEEIKIYTSFDPNSPDKPSPHSTAFTELPTQTITTSNSSQLLNNSGTPSGVPRIFINPLGLIIALKR